MIILAAYSCAKPLNPSSIAKNKAFFNSLHLHWLNSLMLATSHFLSVCSLDAQGLHLLLSVGLCLHTCSSFKNQANICISE